MIKTIEFNDITDLFDFLRNKSPNIEHIYAQNILKYDYVDALFRTMHRFIASHPSIKYDDYPELGKLFFISRTFNSIVSVAPHFNNHDDIQYAYASVLKKLSDVDSIFKNHDIFANIAIPFIYKSSHLFLTDADDVKKINKYVYKYVKKYFPTDLTESKFRKYYSWNDQYLLSAFPADFLNNLNIEKSLECVNGFHTGIAQSNVQTIELNF